MADRVEQACQRFRRAWVHRPFTVVLAVVLTIPGVLALIYGDRVSQALSNVAADHISRSMGAALLVGGITTLAGITRGHTLTELLGLSMLAAGCGLYGIGVIAGLGLAGMVAGPISLAVSFAIIRRVITLATFKARTIDNS